MSKQTPITENPIRHLFAKIAKRYDGMNKIMSLGLDVYWRRSAIRNITLSDKGRILDLACGTGDFTTELAHRWPERKIDGVDLTPEMIDIAREKLVGAKNVVLLQGDAQNLSTLQSSQYSLIVCAFGFRNFPDKRKALSECRRLLVKGGTLVVLELFRPESKIQGAVVDIWLAIISRIFASEACTEYKYLRKSVANTISADEFIAMAKENGFTIRDRLFLPPAAKCLKFEATT